MCIAPLSQDILENMKNFKYKSTDDSLLYQKCMSPCLNKVVNYIPRNIAPNLITFISLCFNILAALISYNDGGFDFTYKLKSSTCIIIGTFQLLYQLLDNIDGKQARRTGNSTPFGMLMDHGCDVFTNIFTAYNLSKLLLVGNDDFFSFSVFLGLLLGFYMMTYEEYKLGEMHFPKINGTDEGNFFIFILGIILGIIGQDSMEYIINEKYNITIGKLIGLGVIIGGISCIFNLYLHTYQNKGYKELTFCAIFTSLTLLWIFIRMIFRGIPSIYRLSKVSDIIEKYRPNKKHVFLSIIGSNKKGGGTLLMNRALEYFGENETLYLECSDPNVNEHFYNKFQFKMFGLETYKGIKEGFMIRIGKRQNIDEYI